jgi:hypothetical protein
MNVVTKKKQPRVEQEGPEEVKQIIYRPDSHEIVAAIEAEARKDRRSRNLMIQILLEEALRARKVWPPS